MSPVIWLLISAFSWNLAYGASQLLIPLYAYELGFSGVAIGSLIALPIILQVVLRFTGGAAADRWGPKSLLLWTYGVLIVTGPVFYYAESYASLLLAQSVMMLSRSTYWISALSAVIRLPGERNLLLGQVTAVNNVGQIVGTGSAGILIVLLGYRTSFLSFSLVGALAVFCALFLPSMPGTGTRKNTGAASRYITLLRRRPIYFAMLCSFFGALPLSLGQSFIPVLLADLGFAEGPIGILNALRPIGAVAAGLYLARYLTPRRRAFMAQCAVAASALAVGLMPFIPLAIWVGLCMFGLGVGACLMEVTYQVTTTEVGEGIGVTSAMALGGTGMSVSHFFVPILFGSIADATSLPTAFALAGGFFMLISAGTPHFYRWATQTDTKRGTRSRLDQGIHPST